MVYTVRFFSSSKCSLFHNFNVFGSCIIHILYTGCAKIKKNNSGAKRLRLPDTLLTTQRSQSVGWSAGPALVGQARKKKTPCIRLYPAPPFFFVFSPFYPNQPKFRGTGNGIHCPSCYSPLPISGNLRGMNWWKEEGKVWCRVWDQ